MIELFHSPNYNFIGRRKWAYIVSITITVLGLISLAIHGLHYDIDFTGGTLVQVRFEKPPSVGTIRSGLSRIKRWEYSSPYCARRSVDRKTARPFKPWQYG